MSAPLRMLWLVASVAAGLALGSFSSLYREEKSPPANGIASLPKEKQGALNGASAPREVALGTALAELRRTDSSLSGLVALGAAIEQLDSAQIARLLAQAEPAPSTWRGSTGRLAWLFKWWMKRDPAAAAKWVRPRLEALAQDGPLGIYFASSSLGQLVLAWADTKPDGALTFARAHSRTGLATALLLQVAGYRGNEPPAEQLAVILGFPAGHAREVALEALHRDWAAQDPAAALASTQTLPPGGAREKAVSEVLAAWADKDSAAAFRLFQELGLSDTRLLTKVLVKNAAKDPLQTIEWLQQLDVAQFTRCAPQITAQWAQREPAAALAWALANGVRLAPREEISSETHHDGFSQNSYTMRSTSTNVLAAALTNDAAAAIAWLRALRAGAERDRVTELAIPAAPTREQALALFAQLPPEAAARTATNIAALYRDDPEQGRAWAMSLPAGAVRERAWAGLTAATGKWFDLPPGPERDAMLSGTLYRPGIESDLCRAARADPRNRQSPAPP